MFFTDPPSIFDNIRKSLYKQTMLDSPSTPLENIFYLDPETNTMKTSPDYVQYAPYTTAFNNTNNLPHSTPQETANMYANLYVKAVTAYCNNMPNTHSLCVNQSKNVAAYTRFVQTLSEPATQPLTITKTLAALAAQTFYAMVAADLSHVRATSFNNLGHADLVNLFVNAPNLETALFVARKFDPTYDDHPGMYPNLPNLVQKHPEMKKAYITKMMPDHVAMAIDAVSASASSWRVESPTTLIERSQNKITITHRVTQGCSATFDASTRKLVSSTCPTASAKSTTAWQQAIKMWSDATVGETGDYKLTGLDKTSELALILRILGKNITTRKSSSSPSSSTPKPVEIYF